MQLFYSSYIFNLYAFLSTFLSYEYNKMLVVIFNASIVSEILWMHGFVAKFFNSCSYDVHLGRMVLKLNVKLLTNNNIEGINSN